MLPLAHIGITILFASLLYMPIVAVLVGSIVPDIVDKVLFVVGIGSCGRFFGHSIFFGPMAAAITFLVTKRKNIALAILFGCYMHLLEDARFFLPLFYPLVQYDFYCLPTIIRPDLIDIGFEGIGAMLVPITFTLKPKMKYFKRFLQKKIKIMK